MQNWKGLKKKSKEGMPVMNGLAFITTLFLQDKLHSTN